MLEFFDILRKEPKAAGLDIVGAYLKGSEGCEDLFELWDWVAEVGSRHLGLCQGIADLI